MAAYPREGFSPGPTAFEDLIGAFWRFRVLSLPFLFSCAAMFGLVAGILEFIPHSPMPPGGFLLVGAIYCSPLSIGLYMSTAFVMRNMERVLGPATPMSVFWMTVVGVLPIANVVLFVRLYRMVCRRMDQLGIRPILLWIREGDKAKVKRRLLEEAASGVDMSKPPSLG